MPNYCINSFRQQNASSSHRICFQCHKPGRLARNCFSNPGQSSFNVPNDQGKNFSNRQPPVCYRCGKRGHISKFCCAKLEDTCSKESMHDQNQGMNSSQNKTDSKIRLSTISPASKRKTLMVEAQINGKSKLCILDTGATISLISKDEWQSLKPSNVSLSPSDIVAEADNNSPIGILGKTTLDVHVNDGQMSSHQFYVANEIISEIILGLDWLINNKVIVDVANGIEISRCNDEIYVCI